MKLSLRAKFLLLILPLIGISVVLLALIVTPYRGIPQDVQELQERVSRTILAQKFARLCMDQIRGYSHIAIAPEQKQVDDLARSIVATHNALAELMKKQNSTSKDLDMQALLAEVQQDYGHLTQIGEKVAALSLQKRGIEAKTMIHDELDSLTDNSLKPRLERLVQQEEARTEAKLQEIQGVGVFLFFAPPRLHRTIQGLDSYIYEATLAENFGRLFSSEMNEYTDYLLFSDREQEREIEAERTTADSGLQVLIQHVQRADPNDLVLPVLHQIEVDHKQVWALGQKIVRLVSESKIAEAKGILSTDLESIGDISVVRKIDALTSTEQGELEEEVRKIVFDTRLAVAMIGGVSLLVLLVGFGCPWLLARKIVRPIIELRDAATRVGAGDLQARVHIASADEIGELSGTFNKMAEDLKRNLQQREQVEKTLKEFTAKLERSNRELQDFASVASHDLQEPLRKIQAFGDRLRVKYTEVLGVDGKDYLNRMLNASARMQTLINDLLTFSRVTSKAQPFVPVDLAKITREVLSDLEVRIQETGGRVEVGEMLNIDADPLQMRQLLQNLIGNALKFHRDETPPLVKLHSNRLNGNGDCQIVIEDNGIGFDEKYVERIFVVFQRLHGREKYAGTGIGLAVCRKIAERHGGNITASSKPGQGATFTVTLPIHHNQGTK
jgi:signal transduction histidine kinase